MSDLGDIFDIFSNEGGNDSKSQQQTGMPKQAEKDTRSSIIGKFTRNKPLLITTVVVGLAILGIVGLFLFKYIGANGVSGIINFIKPFLN
jgi:hypothetical protein